MKKFNFILGLLLLWITGAVSAGAVVTDNYKQLFDMPIDTSNPEFSPALGWGHYTSGFATNASGDLFHPSYSWKSGFAIDGQSYNSLDVATQTGKDKDGAYKTDLDLIITPAITGKSSIWTKASAYSYDLIVYQMKEDGGKWVPDGEPIANLTSKVSNWYNQKVDLPEVEGKRLGIFASCVKLAYFEADKVDIPETKQLSFFDVSKVDQYITANDNGEYTVSVTASLKNTGNVDIAADEENYTVSLLDSKGNVLVTVPVATGLKVGETTAVEGLSFTRKYSEFNSTETISLVENLSGNKYTVGTYTPVSNEPKMQIFASDGSGELAEDAVIDFGKTRADVYKKFSVKNDGGGTLNITGVEMPAGFATTIDAVGLTVAPHTSQDFSIILKSDIVGVHEGSVKLVAGDLAKEIKVKGVTTPETTWTATFEDKQLPAGSRSEGEGTYYRWNVDTYYKKNSPWATDNDVVTLNINSYEEEYKFITPRLKFADGETFDFDAAISPQASTYSPQTTGFNVYYSANGSTDWQLARAIDISELPTEKLGYKYKSLRVAVDNIPAGSWFIGIGANKGEIDNIVGGTLDPDAHAWVLKSSDIPASAEVNSPYTASITLSNVNAVDDKADTYKVSLYVDDELVATAQGVDIKAGENGTVAVSYTPHESGATSVKLVAEATDADYTLATDNASVNVKEEAALADVQVGKADNNNDGRTPFYLYNEINETEILYPVSKLSGLKNGDKISQVVFRGKSSSTLLNNVVRMWIENTEDETVATPFTERGTDNMTKVFDGKISFVSPDGKGDTFGDYITISFDQPFVYEGKGLRLHLFQNYTEGYGQNVQFESENDKTLCYNRNIYNGYDISNRPYSAQNLPVAHFGIVLDPKKVSSNVTDKSGNAIAGAMVTLKSGDVEYYALTGEDGKYTANVVKSSLSYESTVEAPGYKDATDKQVNLDAPATAKLGLDDIVLDKGDMAFLVASEDVSAEELADPDFSEDGTVYELQSVADNKAQFALATSLMKGHAYLFVSKADDVISEMSELDNSINLADEKTITLDGADIVTYLSRRALAPVDGKKTFRVVEGAFKAVDFDQTEELERLHMNYSSPFEGVLNVATEATELEIVLNDVPSGISTVGADKANAAGDIYTVSGVKVAQKSAKALKSGVYIMNGKKVVVK